jgi:hypothetical protein
MPPFERGLFNSSDALEPETPKDISQYSSKESPAIEVVSPPEEISATEPFTPVLVDGRALGYKRLTLPLQDFNHLAKLKECFLETESNNIYGIFKQEGQIIMADARSNLGKGHNTPFNVLKDAIIENMTIRVGEVFNFGSGNTSVVTSITVVTGSHYLYDPHNTLDEVREVAEKYTGGQTTDVRSRFLSLLGRTS